MPVFPYSNIGDDTILFMEHNFEEAKNVKLLLTAFEHLSCLKINFCKSELSCYGEAKEAQQEYMNIFLARCPVDDVPFCYLDIQMCHTRLLNKELKLIEERFERKRSTWKSKMLSYGLGLTLFNSDLISKQSFYVHDLLFLQSLKKFLGN